jgi:hypothetical protein
MGFQTLKFQLQVFYCGFVDNVITITQDLRRYRTGENLCMAFVTTHCILARDFFSTARFQDHRCCRFSMYHAGTIL